MSAFVILSSVFCLIPFYIMIVMGTYYSENMFKQLPLLPSNYLMQNLKTILEGGFLLYYWNSLYVAVLFTFLSLFFAALAGFAFAKYEFKFKKSLFTFILATMMVPGHLGLIAFVMQMGWLNFNNTHLPLLVGVASNAFGVFFMTQFIRSSVPTEILESGRMDGCNEFGIFYKIVLPFLLPALSTLGMLFFLASWNNYIVPLVTIHKSKLFTMPLGIANLGNMFRLDYSAQILGLSLGTLPLILLFLFASKTFIRGLTGGSVKG